MEIREKIIMVLKENKELTAGQIAEKTGIDKKIIEKEMKKMKEDNVIISPKRCYWSLNK